MEENEKSREYLKIYLEKMKLIGLHKEILEV